MRTRTRVTTAIATGAVATALLASPALAAGQGGIVAPGQGAGRGQQNAQHAATCDGTCTPQGPGTGRGARSGLDRQAAGQGRGAGMGAGTHADLTNVASGTMTDAQKATLAAIAEEEKLAHDLYVAFADAHATPVFTRIATAETRHLAEVRIVLDRYDIADPTADQAAGTFATAAVQRLYNAQLSAGSANLDAAYKAGQLVETTDITDLKAATTGVSAPDVLQVYTNLLAGSERHLVAFGG